MSETVIRVENLSKRYRIGPREPYKTLRDTLAQMFTAPFRKGKREETYPHIWALKNVSFEVKRGEVVGIIGKNGAGKTTLLKILSRITEPTEGYAEIKGRVGSLLEVGIGFHPELTGRENIYFSGAILGMKKQEIDRKFDEIVDFAELEKFIDTPVKYYSSGMHVRLAFAVAAHLEPEILLVDEVLAVGDAAFQKKCLGKMGDVAKEGRTVLFVSHNMGAISNLCKRTLWIDSGKIRADGNSMEVIPAYLCSNISVSGNSWSRPPSLDIPNEIAILSARIIPNDNQGKGIIDFRKSFAMEVVYRINRRIRDLSITFRLYDAQGNIIFSVRNTDTTTFKGTVMGTGVYSTKCIVPGSLLRPGQYWVSIIAHIFRVKIIEQLDHILTFEISRTTCPCEPERPGIITPSFLLEWETTRLE